MLSPSTQPSIRDTVCLENVEMKLTFKLREQRDTFSLKQDRQQGSLLSSLVFSKLSMLIAELFCALVSPSL